MDYFPGLYLLLRILFSCNIQEKNIQTFPICPWKRILAFIFNCCKLGQVSLFILVLVRGGGDDVFVCLSQFSWKRHTRTPKTYLLHQVAWQVSLLASSNHPAIWGKLWFLERGRSQSLGSHPNTSCSWVNQFLISQKMPPLEISWKECQAPDLLPFWLGRKAAGVLRFITGWCWGEVLCLWSLRFSFSVLITYSKGNARAQAKVFFHLLTPDLRRTLLDLFVAQNLVGK